MSVDEMVAGSVTHVGRIGTLVTIWIAPTSGEQMEMITIGCHSEAQAKLVAAKWRKVWAL